MDDCPTTTWIGETEPTTSWNDDNCLGMIATTPITPVVPSGVVFKGTLLSTLGVL